MARVLRVLNWPLVRLVLTIVLFAVLAFGLSVLVLGVLGAPSTFLTVELVNLISIYAALLLVARVVERRPPAAIGLRRQGGVRDLAVGFAIGAGLMCVSVGVLALAGWYRVAAVEPGAAALALLASGLVLQLNIGAFEEGLARGVIFRDLEDALGSWPALVLSAAIFGLAHLANPEATLWGAIAIALEAGVLLAAAFMLTRSLWLPIGIHVSWNFVQGSVFGINISGSNLVQQSLITPAISGPELWTGGAFGIEASPIVLVVSLAAGITMLLLAVRRGHVVTPAWLQRARHRPG
ncbi:MAG: protease family protein [Chloroflexota bacterium]|jgi:membrane protease YdiL (CAAX protease family)|nr:protease family protein [Chloroflexota bacterium]